MQDYMRLNRDKQNNQCSFIISPWTVRIISNSDRIVWSKHPAYEELLYFIFTRRVALSTDIDLSMLNVHFSNANKNLKLRYNDRHAWAYVTLTRWGPDEQWTTVWMTPALRARPGDLAGLWLAEARTNEAWTWGPGIFHRTWVRCTKMKYTDNSYTKLHAISTANYTIMWH